MCQTHQARGLILLDADNFERVVVASLQSVVVIFWGPDCPVCHVLAPTLECAAEVYGDEVVLAALDVTASPQIATRFGVSSLPFILIFAQGVVRDHFMGEIPWNYLRDKIERALLLHPSTLHTTRIHPSHSLHKTPLEL